MDGPEIPAQSDVQIQEIEAIPESRNQTIATREQIPSLVEKPLVASCQRLYDNNLETLSSSANAKDIDGGGYIFIDLDSMSDHNKKVAEELTAAGRATIHDDYDRRNVVRLAIPLSETSTAIEIEHDANTLVEGFIKQKMLWAPTYTMQDIANIYRSDEVLSMDPEELARETGYYYSPEDGVFYVSLEHYDKVHEEIPDEVRIEEKPKE